MVPQAAPNQGLLRAPTLAVLARPKRLLPRPNLAPSRLKRVDFRNLSATAEAAEAARCQVPASAETRAARGRERPQAPAQAPALVRERERVPSPSAAGDHQARAQQAEE